MASVAEDLGWICSTHDDWSWHDPGRTGLILWQPKTPVRTLLERWDGSFRKWVVERRKALLMEAKGHKDFAKVIDDLSGDETFPLAPPSSASWPLGCVEAPGFSSRFALLL